MDFITTEQLKKLIKDSTRETKLSTFSQVSWINRAEIIKYVDADSMLRNLEKLNAKGN